MEYAIETLKEKLQTLENAHNKFVIKGSVKPDSLVAKKNREKVLELQTALAKLESTSSLPIGDVSDSAFLANIKDETIVVIANDVFEAAALLESNYPSSNGEIEFTPRRCISHYR